MIYLFVIFWSGLAMSFLLLAICKVTYFEQNHFIIRSLDHHGCDFGDENLVTWWRHQMETFSELLAICAGNSLVTGEFPAQKPVVRSFDVFFDPRLNKRLNKQSWGWWFETPSRSLRRHCNVAFPSVKTYGMYVIMILIVLWAFGTADTALVKIIVR